MEENKIVIYQTEDGQTQIDVRLENENVWLNVSQMSALFDREESNVRRHVQNAFKEGELERDENNVHFLHVNGVKKPVPFYSLDVIISVGYRVKSKRGTDFRIWARKVLKQYLIKAMPSTSAYARSRLANCVSWYRWWGEPFRIRAASRLTLSLLMSILAVWLEREKRESDARQAVVFEN